MPLHGFHRGWRMQSENQKLKSELKIFVGVEGYFGFRSCEGQFFHHHDGCKYLVIFRPKSQKLYI